MFLQEYYNCSCIDHSDITTPSAYMGDCDTPSCNIIYGAIFLFLIIVTLLLMVQTLNLATVIRYVTPNNFLKKLCESVK